MRFFTRALSYDVVVEVITGEDAIEVASWYAPSFNSTPAGIVAFDSFGYYSGSKVNQVTYSLRYHKQATDGTRLWPRNGATIPKPTGANQPPKNTSKRSVSPRVVRSSPTKPLPRIIELKLPSTKGQ